jgi:hypothetical protein
MNVRIVLEWDEQCGILLSKTYPLIDGVENALVPKNYGASISRIGIVMTCMAKNFKQRKRYKKDTKEFTYDILLDYYLIKNVEIEQKKGIIRKQMADITEQTFSTYKFADFDKAAFLLDFKEIVNAVVW